MTCPLRAVLQPRKTRGCLVRHVRPQAANRGEAPAGPADYHTLCGRDSPNLPVAGWLDRLRDEQPIGPQCALVVRHSLGSVEPLEALGSRSAPFQLAQMSGY